MNSHARRPILLPLSLSPRPLSPSLPLLLLPLQPLIQPALVVLEGVTKHLDVEQDDGFEWSICRRVDRDALELVEDVLASDEAAEDGVLACGRTSSQSLSVIEETARTHRRDGCTDRGK